MALVLAIEPDSAQASTLQRVLPERADAEVVVVDSKGAALATIDERVPDLLLISTLLSPRDEEQLIAHLRTLPNASHLQTLTIPQLEPTSRYKRRFFAGRKQKRKVKGPAACDPLLFADEVVAYLTRACEIKRDQAGDRTVSRH